MADGDMEKKNGIITYAAIAGALVLIVAILVIANKPTQVVDDNFNRSYRSANLFISASPTYSSDGQFLEQEGNETCGSLCWKFSYRFLSFFGKYGRVEDIANTTNLTRNLTLMKEVITVRNGQVESAVINNVWDELNQRYLPVPESI